jgi:hypothetical protein
MVVSVLEMCTYSSLASGANHRSFAHTTKKYTVSVARLAAKVESYSRSGLGYLCPFVVVFTHFANSAVLLIAPMGDSWG